MLLFKALDTTLPLSNPVMIFLVILLIILLAPLLLNRIKIPHLLGLIIAGAIVGPYGFNILERDSAITLLGTGGLLYIMFLAGLEIDLTQFKKNSKKSFIFGMYTFSVPMILGFLTAYYVFQFSLLTSILFASMLASHTLIAYPIISKMGVANNRAVNVAVGGTVITDTLALLVLAVIVAMTQGEVNSEFWIKMSISIIAFAAIVVFVFPIIARWFLKKFSDNISQYIFVLVMLFLGGLLAELAGIEAIIGAFLTGLSLNRLIPRTSPLMNRVEFVGNAIFIPFFLIGVGMLIDFRAFIQGWETIFVATVMIIIAMSAKYIAAWLAQKTFRFSVDERRIIFGLSNAQAAATLAVVLVGYNIILGYTPEGDPIRLLNEHVLNGSILMILVTCTVASFSAQKGAKNIALKEASSADDSETDTFEKILIPISNDETVEELINLGLMIKSEKNKTGLYALSIVDNSKADSAAADKHAKKILHMASGIAAATDNYMHELLRYDLNIVNGITSVIKEHKITDLILGLHVQKGISDSFLGNLTEGILTKSNATTLIYKPTQPIGTIKRHIVVIPENAEEEIGFPFWLVKIWNIIKNSGTQVVFHCSEKTREIIAEINRKHPVECTYNIFTDWDDFLILSKYTSENDNIIIVMSRKDKPSYQNNMTRIPRYLNKYFRENSFILIYPMQTGVDDPHNNDMMYPSMVSSMVKLGEFGKTLSKAFRKKD